MKEGGGRWQALQAGSSRRHSIQENAVAQSKEW